MLPTDELWKAYHDWKQLTERESVAIQREQWNEVHRAQEQKRALQSEILQLTGRVKAGLTSPSAEIDFNARLRVIVNELILLETQNNARVQAAKEAVQSEVQSLTATGHRLRRIHASYIPPCNPFWQTRG